MRSPKQGDSPSNYDREVRPRLSLDVFARHDKRAREDQDERWKRRMSTCLSTDMRPSSEWPGACE